MVSRVAFRFRARSVPVLMVRVRGVARVFVPVGVGHTGTCLVQPAEEGLAACCLAELARDALADLVVRQEVLRGDPVEG